MSNGASDSHISTELNRTPPAAPEGVGDQSPATPHSPERPTPWGELLSSILAETSEDSESSQAEMIARRLVSLALEGDKRAMDMIIDYVYGKADAQPDESPSEPVQVLEIG